MARQTRWILPLGLLLLTLTSCGGGGGAVVPTDAPIISAVTPSGTVGASGATVQFAATASGNPTGWQWEFGAGAFPSTSTAASPDVVLVDGGSYTGSVRATNAGGTSAPFAFRYEVATSTAPPRVLQVFLSRDFPNRGDAVTFSVLATNSPTAWAWDFGGAATPGTSTEKDPTVTLDLAGRITGSVIASNALGESAPFSFEALVTNIPAFTTFVTQQVPFLPAGTVDAVIYRGRAAVAYTDNDAHQAWLVRATTSAPTQPSDWTTSELAYAVASQHIALTPVGNSLVAVYTAEISGRPIRASVTTVEDPTTPADWMVSTISSSVIGGGHFVGPGSIADLNGRPAFGFRGPGNNATVAIAQVPIPTSELDWPKLIIDEGTPGGYGSLITYRDRLAFAYTTGNTGVRFARASIENPQDADSWVIHHLDGPGNETSNGTELQMTIADDRLALIYRTGIEIRFAQSLVEEPLLASDWRHHTIDGGTRAGSLVALADGFVISYAQAGLLRMARSWGPSPMVSPADWQFKSIVPANIAGPSDLVLNGDKLIVAYTARPPGTFDPFGLMLTVAEDPW